MTRTPANASIAAKHLNITCATKKPWLVFVLLSMDFASTPFEEAIETK